MSSRPKRKKSQQTRDSKRNDHARATRETIESIVVAVILAFLFRTFVAEAFVIPTGSMAPTLQGRHMDVTCSECGHEYRTGASVENPDGDSIRPTVTQTVCPICRYQMVLDRSDFNQQSFNGDRILVSKFSYALGKPKRWDVIVFKYPGNAKQNYIKRLVGLPGEYLMIKHGDVWVRPSADTSAELRIARKPDRKLLAMLQLVHDTKFIARDAKAVGWPAPYRPWSLQNGPNEKAWSIVDDGHQYTTDGSADYDTYVRFQNRFPVWDKILKRYSKGPPYDSLEAADAGNDHELRDPAEVQRFLKTYTPRLITDYYAYNDFYHTMLRAVHPSRRGLHWVGDLAIEGSVKVESKSGELLLDLVEGGVHFRCRIDVATGEATMSIDGGPGQFGDDGEFQAKATAKTVITKPGKYWVRLSNVDDEVRLWVNNRRVKFDVATTYKRAADAVPQWTSKDPLDLAPAGIGSRGAALHVDRIKLFRDGYYIASKNNNADRDYDGIDPSIVSRRLHDPATWEQPISQYEAGTLFSKRGSIDFKIPLHGYLPLGDNSPQSKDARYWSRPADAVKPTPTPEYVDQKLMIGKAMLVYWPHAWRTKLHRKVGVPNFQRMGFIK